MVLLKVIHIFNIYRNTKFHDTPLIGASFASSSKVGTTAVWKWLKVWGANVWGGGHLQRHDLPSEPDENVLNCSKLLGGLTVIYCSLELSVPWPGLKPRDSQI
jgi:hypothetical protein